MNEIIKYVALSFWLLSLRIIHLKSIHIFLFNSSSFQFIVEMYFIICIYQYLLPIQYLEGIWLGFRFSQLWIRLLKHFHAVFYMKICLFFFGKHLGLGISEPYVKFIFNFLRIWKTFPKWRENFSFLSAIHKCIRCLHLYQHLVVSFLFKHFDRCEVLIFCDFKLHFSHVWWC